MNRYSEDSTEISYEEKLYETQCEAIGDTDGATMNTLNNIVALCLNADDYAKAVIYLAKLHDAQCRTLGELSMPAFDTIDLLCKSCIMVIESGDIAIFTTSLVGAYDGKILKIFKDIVDFLVSAEEYSAARSVYEIIYRYYSEIEGIDSQNAIEYKKLLDNLSEK